MVGYRATTIVGKRPSQKSKSTRPQRMFYSNLLSVKAKILTGPPVPPAIFIGWTISLNPLAGSVVVQFRATFSRLYRLAFDSTPCTEYVLLLPGSRLGTSTPTPYTLPESTIHCAASLDSPGNLRELKKNVNWVSRQKNSTAMYDATCTGAIKSSPNPENPVRNESW